MAVPGWPEPACWTASIARTLTRSTALASVSDQSSATSSGWLLTAAWSPNKSGQGYQNDPISRGAGGNLPVR